MSKPVPEPLFTLHGDMDAVHCIYHHIKIDPDGCSLSSVYCGTESGQVHIWDSKMMRQLNKIKVGELPCVAIEYCKHFITQEKGGDITFWNQNLNYDWTKITSFSCDYKTFCKIQSIGDLLLYPCSDSQIKISNVCDAIASSSDGITSKDNEFGMIMGAKCLIERNSVLIGFENGSFSVANVTDGSFKSVCKFSSECPISFDYCESSDYGVVGYTNNDLIKFKIVDDGLKKIVVKELTNSGTNCVAIREDGLLFAVSTWDHAIRYFSGKTLKLLAVLHHHILPVECLKFVPSTDNSNEETYLLAGGRDGRVSLWNLYSDSFVKQANVGNET